ncbi:MAG: cytochrome c oxidase assembly factor Coa1 family protein, partial [Pseudomonadota bacterium]
SVPYPNDAPDAPIPPHLNKWNWGAFWLNWIWGIAHSTYIALLMFVPFVNLVMVFVLGAKGSKWAWKNRVWRDEEHFVKTQRGWAIAGWCLLFFMIVFTVAILWSVSALFKGSEAYKLTMEEVRSNKDVITILGSPIEEGFIPTGSINLSGTSGAADFALPISGPNCKATVLSKMRKKNGEWSFDFLMVRTHCNDGKIIIKNNTGRSLPNSSNDQDV